MKLREFMANSFPRVRGRKKKGQQAASQVTTITAATVTVASATTSPAQNRQLPDEVLSATPQKLSKQDGNGNWFHISETKLSFLERLVGKDSPVKRLLGSKDRHTAYYTARGCDSVVCPSGDGSASCSTAVAVEYSSTSVTLGTSSHEEEGYCECADTVPSQVCTCDEPFGDCDHQSLNGYSLCCTDGVTLPEGLRSPDSISCSSSQRAPRSRSRIRTNPWLPSPRPSPYSVRSFSSPCTSSRSASPSPSPPPSSSDNTSPLTSPKGRVRVYPETGHSRWRRHRRHHSEVKVSEVTDLLPFDPLIADSEQYCSTVDSGLGEAGRRGHRVTKRGYDDLQKNSRTAWSGLTGQRECQYAKDIDLSGDYSSPAPKQKAKSKSKSRPRSHHYVALSVEPGHGHRASPVPSSLVPQSVMAQGSAHARRDWMGHPSFPTVVNRESACWGSDSESESACVLLSPSDDICVLTSNIEQLAHNISSEYEDALDTTFDSETTFHDKSSDSLDVLLDSASDLIDHCAIGNPTTGPQAPNQNRNKSDCAKNDSQLGYRGTCNDCKIIEFETEENNKESSSSNDVSFSSCNSTSAISNSTDQPFSQEDLVKRDSSFVDYYRLCADVYDADDAEVTKQDQAAAVIAAGFQSLQGQSSPSSTTTDAAVQTDFADDEDEDFVNSDSDWMMSGGSEDVTDSEWLITDKGTAVAGEGGGEEEAESSIGDESEDRKVWIIPDCMQDSTDTGYSSLSRDGNADADDDSNEGSGEHSLSRQSSDRGDLSPQSYLCQQSCPCTVNSCQFQRVQQRNNEDNVHGKLNSIHGEGRCFPIDTAQFTMNTVQFPMESLHVGKTVFCSKNGAIFDKKPHGCYAHSLTFNRAISPVRQVSRRQNHVLQNTTAGPTVCERNVSGNIFVPDNSSAQRINRDLLDYCCCDVSISELMEKSEADRSLTANFRESHNRHSHYDNLVPYPYDVTQFSDVTQFGDLTQFNDVGQFGDVTHYNHGQVASPSSHREGVSEKPKPSRGRKSKYAPKTSTPSYNRTVVMSHANSHFASGTEDGLNAPAPHFSATAPAMYCDLFPADQPFPSPIPHQYSCDSPFACQSSKSMKPSASSTLKTDKEREKTEKGREKRSNSHPSSAQDDMSAALCQDQNLSPSGRSLGDIAASLEDKVFFLRQGKQLVNRKIREAREEEMLRQQQKLRFQRLLDIHRKQILLETLQDLRHRLESQSARLQASYSAVLDMQKRYA